MSISKDKKLIIWVEITANKKLILNTEAFGSAMERCRDCGVTGIILSVKDTTGFVIYDSSIAPHYSSYDHDFGRNDYAKECRDMIKGCDMDFYAAFDVFAEGNKKNRSEYMKGLCTDGFECMTYGLDAQGHVQIRKSTEAADLKTAGSIDDFGEIFVNPANKEVQRYELSLISEFAGKYEPDGIVLDRARYVGLSSDFSVLSRDDFKEYTGIKDLNWPEDIYTIAKEDDDSKDIHMTAKKDGSKDIYHEVPGRYFGEFYQYRAHVIHDFICKAADAVHGVSSKIRFMNYTGSWYPLYYIVGVNWADSRYIPDEFPWIKDSKSFAQTGYAKRLDTLFSGCYYEDVMRIDAEKSGRPAYWYSVEGAADYTKKATADKKNVIDSIFLDQYKDHPCRITQSVNVCMEHSEGCMVFDLSYITDRNLWRYMERTDIRKWNNNDADSVAKLCVSGFDKAYHITEDRVRRNLFKMRQYSSGDSFVAEDKDGIKGFIGVKVSDERELYPDTAWISIMTVDKNHRGMGYGRILLQKAIESLRRRGIRKIYIGQDFDNFFSGIPSPTEDKMKFFADAGFTLNKDEHYDLEADIVDNKKMDGFDASGFDKEFRCEPYDGERNGLLEFLNKEFPGRWVYEAETALDEGKANGEIVVMKDIRTSKIKGYCMLSAVQGRDGKKTGYGGLGPIGIAKDIRGRCVGNFILQRSLMQLRAIGVTRVNIDWTILKDFYGQFDFKPERTYRAGYRTT